MPKYLITESLRDLVNQQFNNEWLEDEYRRGYVDAIISLTSDLAKGPVLIRKSSLKERLLDHWARLLDWQTDGRQDEPPAFEWRKPSFAHLSSARNQQGKME